ncbi:MAG: ADOP family duplicated permease [Terriglobales bacterium]
MRFLRWNRQDDELTQELRNHIEMAVQERMERGQSRAEAEAAVRREFGNELLVREATRQQWGWLWLEQLAQDLRFAFRMLRRSPGFTAVAVLTLAIGIGANTAILSVVDGVLLQPLPYPASDRVAKVFMHFLPQNAPRGHMCQADFLDWNAQNHAFEEVSAYANGLYNITGIGTPEQARGVSVTAGFFSIMRVPPLIGRTIGGGEDSPTAPSVVVLGERLWRHRFGASAAALGEVIDANGEKATIIGVMPDSFRFPREDAEIWTNLHLTPPKGRFPFFLTGVARLRPEVTWKQAQAETNKIGRTIELAGNGEYRNLTMPVVPIREELVGDVRLPLLMMFGAVVAVLLIASVNVANLLLARSSARAREMAVRVSIGARRSRLVRQLLTENLALSLAGATVGIGLAWYAVRLLRVLNPGNLPRIDAVRLNAPVLGFTVVTAILTAVLFGVGPALESARTEPVRGLKDDARAGGGKSRTRAALVVAEIALSFVLLIVGGLLLRSFERLQRVNTGIETPPDELLTMLVSPSATRYKDPKAQLAILDRLIEQILQVPGVEAAAWSDSRPPNYWSNDDTFKIKGKPYNHEAFPSSPIPTVTPQYFSALGIPLIRGRYFEDSDAASRPNVAVISQELARRYFPSEDPIGQEIAPSEPSLKQPWYRIVGIVGDVKYAGMASEPAPVWYAAVAQSPGLPMFLIVRSSRQASALGDEIERAIHSVDPEVVVTYRETLATVMGNAVAQPRFRTALLSLFAVIALVLASIGTYGVIAYSVTQRTREIGVRMALGAQPAQVLRMILRQGAGLSALGILIGVAGALAATRAVSSLLFATSPTDAMTFAAVIAVLIGVSLWATFLPARRAMRVNPVEALRWE